MLKWSAWRAMISPCCVTVMVFGFHRLVIFHPSPSLVNLTAHGPAVSLFQTRCKHDSSKSRVLPWNVFGGTYNDSQTHSHKHGSALQLSTNTKYRKWKSIWNSIQPSHIQMNRNEMIAPTNQHTPTQWKLHLHVSMSVSKNTCWIHVVTRQSPRLNWLWKAAKNLDAFPEESGCGNILGIDLFYGFNSRWRGAGWPYTGARP